MRKTWYVEITHVDPGFALITGYVDTPEGIADAYGVFLYLMYDDTGLPVNFVMLKSEEADGVIAIRREDVSVVNIHPMTND